MHILKSYNSETLYFSKKNFPFNELYKHVEYVPEWVESIILRATNLEHQQEKNVSFKKQVSGENIYIIFSDSNYIIKMFFINNFYMRINKKHLKNSKEIQNNSA